MDVQIMIEYCELVIALIYVARSGQKESHWTVITFFGMIGALSVDIFILQGDKSVWTWLLLNVPFSIFIYEKVLRKLVLAAFRRILVSLAMLLDADAAVPDELRSSVAPLLLTLLAKAADLLRCFRQ